MEIPEINDNFIWISERDLFSKRIHSFHGQLNTFHRIDLFISQIEQIDEKYILFDCIDEYEPPLYIDEHVWQFLNQKLKKVNKYLFFILGSPDQKNYRNTSWLNSNIKKLHLPLASIYWTIQELENQNFHNNTKEGFHTNYLIRCLNRAPHTHRCIIIDKLQKYNLIDNNFVSWNVLSENYKFKYFKQRKIIQDYNFDDIHQNAVMFKKQLPSALFDIVSESNTDFLFYSEKTWKSYMQNNSMSIFFGSINQNHSLQKYGFKLYDEIIDYKFDTYTNFEDRVEGFLQQIISLKNHDYNEIYEKVKNKIKYNKNNVIKIFNEKNNLDKSTEFLKSKKLNDYLYQSIFDETLSYKTIKNL